MRLRLACNDGLKTHSQYNDNDPGIILVVHENVETGVLFTWHVNANKMHFSHSIKGNIEINVVSIVSWKKYSFLMKQLITINMSE